jgi:hypothetical protein
MPNFDGMGPTGEGPKTGRGQGDCDDNQTPKYSSRPRLGRRGFFGGFRPFARRRITKKDLQEYKQDLEEEIKEVEQDIENINE